MAKTHGLPRHCTCGCVADLRYYRHSPDGLQFLRCRHCGRIMSEVPDSELREWQREMVGTVHTETPEEHAGHKSKMLTM